MKHITAFALYLVFLPFFVPSMGVAQERPPSPVRYTEAKEHEVRRANPASRIRRGENFESRCQ